AHGYRAGHYHATFLRLQRALSREPHAGLAESVQSDQPAWIRSRRAERPADRNARTTRAGFRRPGPRFRSHDHYRLGSPRQTGPLSVRTPAAEADRIGWIRRLGGYLLKHRRDVALALTGALLGSACQALVPLISRQIVDGVIVRHDSPLWPWLALLVVVAV